MKKQVFASSLPAETNEAIHLLLIVEIASKEFLC